MFVDEHESVWYMSNAFEIQSLLNLCHCYQFTFIITPNKQTPISKKTLKVIHTHTHMHTHIPTYKRERVLKPLIMCITTNTTSMLYEKPCERYMTNNRYTHTHTLSF